MSATAVELNRIAALLAVAPADVSFLAGLEASRLLRLRKAITDAGSARHRRTFERMARASLLLPVAIAAKIAQDVFGPELIASMAPFMPIERAAAVSTRLPAAFQAEIAVHLNPESSSDLLAALPQAIRSAVTRVLLERGEYAVMGTVVDYLPVDVVASLAREIHDPAALLAITSYVEDKSRLRDAVAGFSEPMIERMLELAAANGSMSVLVELAAAMPAAERTRLQALNQRQPEAVREAWNQARSSLGSAD